MNKPFSAANSAPVRQLPHNIEAEQALLGAILIDNDAMDAAGDIAGPQHFFDPLHGRVFEAMSQLIQAGRLASPTTLKTFFDNEEPIGGITVPQYLGRLASHATSVINAPHYAQTVRDLSDRRELIVLGEEMAALAADSPVDAAPALQIELAERRLFEIAEAGKTSGREHTASDMVTAALAAISAAYRSGSRLAGLSTGFTDLDRDIGGLAPSDLIVLAGRPAMGKSALAMGIAYNVAKDLQRQAAETGEHAGEVLVFSLEMSADQIALRQMAQDSGVPAPKMRNGSISEDEFRKVAEASAAHHSLPMMVDDTGGITIEQMRLRARRRKRRKNVKLIVVDYLQLMSGGEGNRGDGRVAEITRITTGLKAMAKELNVPVLALSQLSRQVENRENKRPQLSDLRESGSIEQDADIVLFVYREEYYWRLANPEPSPSAAEHSAWVGKVKDKEDEFGVAEIIRAKNRHGAAGMTKMEFEAEYARFRDLTRKKDNAAQEDGNA